ncbi:site-specific integrase [Gordonia sputi]|uniref:tyrosine-type recombinase/integrase n=1 Tax=Gordonia sputi TaxID=36823 RepID=UPI002044B74B|nr:site-specific integrase [Gordonia sputi]MCM3897109.1 site-specific integrase [Gordonia sputi]
MTRSKGEGTVRQRPNGRYEARKWVVSADGVRQRVSGYGANAKEAIADRDMKCKALAEGNPIRSATATIAQVAEVWRTTTLPGIGTQNTRDTYACRCRVHIEDRPLGQIRLRDLKVGHVERWLNTSTAAPSSRRQDLIILRHILDMAVRDKLIGSNPAKAVKLPVVERGDAEHLDMATVTRIIAYTEQHSRYGTAVRLLATTGMRRGECLALRWRDVDMSTGEIAVRGTVVGSGQALRRQSYPKGKRSRRFTVPPQMIAELRKQRARQKQDRLAAVVWLDTDDLVFTTAAGTPVYGRNLLRVVQTAAEHCGVTQRVGVHTLRHSVATHLLYTAKTPADVVQRLLGHKDVQTTLEVYGHPSSLDVGEAVSNISSTLLGVDTPGSTPELSDDNQKTAGD